MPLENFNGETFVAFTDISGFKALMLQNDRAGQALDRFYTVGYHSLNEVNQFGRPTVAGLFISDCAVLFVEADTFGPKEPSLEALLIAVEAINRQMLRHDYMLTTSIAFGHFSYHKRIEYVGIEKNPVYGNAYVNAFLDNEKGRRKLEPGQCRIVRRNTEQFNFENLPSFRRILSDRHYHYFHWMVNHRDEIEKFAEDYGDSYNVKYTGMLRALKRSAGVD